MPWEDIFGLYQSVKQFSKFLNVLPFYDALLFQDLSVSMFVGQPKTCMRVFFRRDFFKGHKTNERFL